MRLIILNNNLKEALRSLEGVIGDNLNLPILKNILIKTEDNKINFSATNLELAVIYRAAGKIIETGSLTVPLNIFANIINNLTSERITLENKNYNLLIKTDNYEATIQGLNPEDFPIIPKINHLDKFFKINSKIFKNTILKIINSIQYSEIRPEINGAFFNYQIDNLKLTGTDSFRLAEKTIAADKFKCNFEEGLEVILPLKTLQEILRIIPNDGELNIFINQNQVLFKTEELEIISRLIDGKFPDYQSIIPKETKTELVINRDELINALKLTGIFSGRVNEVKFKIGENKKFLEIYSADSALGENHYLLPAKITGPTLAVSFNCRYLLDGLKPLSEKEIILGLNSDNQPAIIKTPEDKTWFYVLMPIKS
jgi:DNA polymerase-3 subunit beta